MARAFEWPFRPAWPAIGRATGISSIDLSSLRDHLRTMMYATRMLCVLLVALALWCVGSGMNGPIAAHAAAMEAGQGASHHDPMAHKLHEGGDTHSVAAHVHATCTAMAGHYIEATGHFSCETPSADCSRISFGRLDGPDPNGLSPEATTPPPRA